MLYEERLMQFRQALPINEVDTYARLMLASILMKLCLFDEARTHFEFVHSVYPQAKIALKELEQA